MLHLLRLATLDSPIYRQKGCQYSKKRLSNCFIKEKTIRREIVSRPGFHYWMEFHTILNKKTAGMIIIPKHIKRLSDMYEIPDIGETFFTCVVQLNNKSRERIS